MRIEGGLAIPRQQFAMNRSVTALPEVTGVTQVLANGQDKILDGTFGAIDGRGQTTGSVLPVNAIQTLMPGSCDPALHRRQGYIKIRSDLPHRNTAANGGDHLATSLCRVGFLLMAGSLKKGFLPC